MLKNKYQRMTKEEKKELRTKFFNTDEGKLFKKRITRVLIFGVIAFIYSIYLFIDNYTTINSIWIYTIAITVFIASIIFIIGYFKVSNKTYNNYAIKK